MKNILVPIDFSATSHNAAKYAVSLAEIFKSKVIFLNVVPDTLIIDEEAAQATISMNQELVSKNKDLMAKEIIALSRNHKTQKKGYVEDRGIR